MIASENILGLTWEDLRRDSHLRTQFREAFLAYAESIHELIVEPDSITTDQLINRFESQGFWSGINHRIYFSFSSGFASEPRW